MKYLALILILIAGVTLGLAWHLAHDLRLTRSTALLAWACLWGPIFGIAWAGAYIGWRLERQDKALRRASMLVVGYGQAADEQRERLEINQTRIMQAMGLTPATTDPVNPGEVISATRGGGP